MLLSLKNIRSTIGEKEVLKGVNLNVDRGEIHVLMGPNGIGKSTMAHVLMGNKNYNLLSGSVTLAGEDITNLSTAERARKGLFLGFQYPVSVPGLKISEYLRNLHNMIHGTQVGVSEFRKLLKDKLEMLEMDRSILSRYLNEGLSGGEMKRLEMLQLAVVKPKVAVLDEIDSGVDVDAQKTIAEAIKRLCKQDGTAFILITHYQRLPNLVNPNKVHVVLDGQIVQTGDKTLVDAVEREGYDWFRQKIPAAAQPAHV